MTKQIHPQLLHNLVLLLREKSPEDSTYDPSVDERSGFPTRNSSVSDVLASHGEDHTTGKNGEEETPIIFLLTQMGKELLIHDDLNVQKKKFVSESHLVIQRDGNCVTVSSKNGLLYAVVWLCGGKKREGEERTTAEEKVTEREPPTERNKHNRVLSTIKRTSNKFEANLNYYVSYAKGTFQLRRIHLLECSQMVWDFQFCKGDLRRRIRYAHWSKCLCFVLSPRLLVREHALFLSGLVRRLGRSSRGALFHVVEEGGRAVRAAPPVGEVAVDTAADDTVEAPRERPRRANQQKTPFLRKIRAILSLLKEENSNLRSLYHLEDYTKIFLHNCDQLNRKSFLSFLKQMDHLHVHAVNLNTLFGLYFSETEENILKVFRKCERVSKRTSRSVCLVLDGIDVLARQSGKSGKSGKSGQNCGEGLDDGCEDLRDDSPGGEANDNGRLLTTLLLCLDSIDSYSTGRRRPRRRAAAQREHDEGNTGDNLCKGGNPARGGQKKKHSPEEDLEEEEEEEEESDHTGSPSTDEGAKKKLKRKKLATHVTFDIKQLAKIYKEKHTQMTRRKKKKYISIVVLSDLDLKHFDASLTRAGRFFHFIKCE
ncbi:conserved Plasmodium protein, unknown function [Plasmodium vivax]|uniref:ATPase AAA-type core domain-containing protein n=1 Tax=Plasmodium vivax TaxID=5855 RepID=A0A1G4H639_PLAVI|nr:conserved Plasmodium protein, unknown function [Plasmodium vivax]